jgi:hypothetical protein
MVGSSTYRRPHIETVSPEKVHVNDLRPTITLTGLFATDIVRVRLEGPRSVSLGEFPVMRLSAERGRVDFPLPSYRDNPPLLPGTYQAVVELTVPGNHCASRGDAPLVVSPPWPGKRWFVAYLQEVRVIDDKETNDDIPAEFRFIMGGASQQRDFEHNARKVAYPADLYVAATEENPVWLTDGRRSDLLTTLHPNAPIFWDLLEGMGPEIQFSVLAYEWDTAPSWSRWAPVAAEAYATGIGCYVGANTGAVGSSCKAGNEIGKVAAEFLREHLSDENDHLGHWDIKCGSRHNYCLLPGNHKLPPMEQTIQDENGNDMLTLVIGIREVTAPRVNQLSVDLRSLEFLDWKHGNHDIHLTTRVTPLNGATGDDLNRARRLPKDMSNSFVMCAARDRGRSNTLCPSATHIDFDGREDSVLFPLPGDPNVQEGIDEPLSAQDVHGLPAVYVEIGVWQGDKLVGMHSEIYWIADLLGDSHEYRGRFSPTVEGIANFGRGGDSDPRVCPPDCSPETFYSAAKITYELFIRRD